MNKILYSAFIVAISSVLTFSDNLLAQDSYVTVAHLKNSFEEKVTNKYQEKVYLHTDRSIYISGETIWIKAYCVDAMLHYPSDLSKVLNIEILDLSGNVNEQIRIQLKDGFGVGQFFISPKLKSGKFILRAYTNWMRNFDPELVFQKNITVINPSVLPGNDLDPKRETNELIVNFFPEGGDLVNGLISKVAIKVVDEYGTGQSLEGIIFDDEENEITKFTTSDQGYSSFNITPVFGKLYTARFLVDNVIQKHVLPDSKKTGIVISLKKHLNDNWNLSISSTQSFEERVYLVTHNRGIVQQIKQVDLLKSKDIELILNEHYSGISHITVLDKNFIPQAERLVFQYPDDKQLLKIEMPKESFGKREKVTITLDGGNLDNDVIGQLSISVYLANTKIQNENIISNLLLTADLKGIIPDAWTYFDPKNSRKDEQIDLLMLTHGWRRFEWNNLLSSEIINSHYMAEINAPVISGHILGDYKINDTFTSLQMSFSGYSSTFGSTILDHDGHFVFEVPFRVRNDLVYFFDENDTFSEDQLILDSPFDLGYTSTYKDEGFFDTSLKDYLEKLSTNIQISQIYKSYSFINGQELPLKNIDYHFYGKPDKVYVLDDYTRFETMEDLFIEYISDIYIRNRENSRNFYVVGETPLPGKALVLIDGLQIMDFDFIMKLDPLKLAKIEIIDKMYYAGNQSYSGIVNFCSYKGDFAGLEVPGNLLEKSYQALQAKRVFYSPDYILNDNKLDRIPDYRNTLYWNPNVVIDNTNNLELEFYTADDVGEYRIQINGITGNGKPFQSVSGFKVVNE
jgi:hypothetical protein